MSFPPKLLANMLTKQLLLVALICGCSSNEVPSVVTKLGKVVGHYLTSFGGKKYEAYQGIPYALPPIGDRRFKSPVPVTPWSGELVATQLRSRCWQHDRVPSEDGSFVKGGDEDCLYLNVFVPEKKANKPALPVLLWIHGGAFLYDGNTPKEEAFLMDHDVIVASIQYRVGALGFLSTEDEVVPGNMGLKDQSLAIKWVHENVEYFGGDPKKITLFGLSAGGASVQFHYLSPMSAGLFQNGISYSATAFHPSVITENPRQRALELGKLVNCPIANVEKMVQCLKERPAYDIVKVQSHFMHWRMTPFVPFGPVVEKSSKNPFIDRSPLEIIESGKAYDVPWITGVVSEEGLYPLIEWTDESILKEINDDWDTIAPYLLDFYDTIPKEDHTKVAQKIKKHYFGEKSINKNTFITLVHLVGDRFFIVSAENAAKAQAKASKSPVWYYYYDYRATESSGNRRANSNTSEYFGVCHGDDVYLFMKNADMSPTKSARDMAMHKVMINMLTSFAIGGKPRLDVEWPKVDSSDNFNYLHISGPENENIMPKVAENLGQRRFWNSIGFREDTISIGAQTKTSRTPNEEL